LPQVEKKLDDSSTQPNFGSEEENGGGAKINFILKTLKVQKERLDYKMVSNALRQCKT
jgi:hypothetical protein